MLIVGSAESFAESLMPCLGAALRSSMGSRSLSLLVAVNTGLNRLSLGDDFWRSPPLWLQGSTHGIWALIYLLLAVTAVYLIRVKPDIPKKLRALMRWAIAIFLLLSIANGMAIIALAYPLSGAASLVEAGAAGAAFAVILLVAIPLIPVALETPNPNDLEEINTALAKEVAERKQAEKALLNLTANLERRVEDRTAELAESNERFKQQLQVSEAERKAYAAAEETVRRSELQLRAKTEELETALNELQRTQTQLVHNEKISSLGRLVAGIAHEINNPVNFIYGNLVHAKGYIHDLLDLLQLYEEQYPNRPSSIADKIETIELDFVTTDLPRLLHSMQAGAERIRGIVASLRSFSRSDEQRMRPANLHEGIDSTLMILQSRLKGSAKTAAIKVTKQYGDLPLVDCYAGQLNQVFMNLLTNAVDALEERLPHLENDPPPEIAIRTVLVEPNQVIIGIKDNGPGIETPVQAQLFDPFFTTKEVGKGTGLGLAISYQIVVEKHGGRLECQSRLGEGTEFLITIPVHKGALQLVQNHSV